MIKILLVEDEEPALEYLKKLIADHFPELEVVGEAADIISAKKIIEASKPQIVFLDIELPGNNGFTLLEQCKPIDFELIFTTAFSDYAVKAFEYFALGYLVKPIKLPQLKTTLNVTLNRINQQKVNDKIELMLHMVQTQGHKQKIVSLPTQTGFERVQSENIIYCRAEGNYTSFYLKDQRHIMVSKQLGVYEKILPAHNFVRIHAQYIVNTDFVVRYSKGRGGFVTLSNGEELPVSANRKDHFLESIS